MYNTRLSFTRETIVIICHHVTSPFKSMYFQISCKKSCRTPIEATMMKTNTKWKQIDIHNKHFYCSFLVSVDFLWQSFKHADKLKKAIFSVTFFYHVNEKRDKKSLTIKRFFYFWSVIIFMFIEYCLIFLFALYTCKFCKIAYINCHGSLYKKKKKKKSWRALFETATSLIKLIVFFLSGGE